MARNNTTGKTNRQVLREHAQYLAETDAAVNNGVPCNAPYVISDGRGVRYKAKIVRNRAGDNYRIVIETIPQCVSNEELAPLPQRTLDANGKTDNDYLDEVAPF